MASRPALIGALLIVGAAAQAFDLTFDTQSRDDDLGDRLRAASLVAGLKDADEDFSPQDVLSAARADYSRLVGALYDQGYFAPEVSIRVNGQEAAALPAIARISSIQRVDIAVTSGKRFRFGETALGPLPQGTDLPEGFGTGERASTDVMREAVATGLSAWRDQGHAKAETGAQTITARHEVNRLDVDIRLEPGPRLRFGDVIITGNEAMRTERVRAIAGLPQGEVYSPADLRRAAKRLRRSGVFESVSLVEADNPNADQTLDITAQVSEAKPRRFGFGAELSSREGVQLSAFWLHRNLLGGGERLRFDAEVRGIGGDTAGRDYELGVSFGRPATFSVNTDFFANAKVISEDEPNYQSERVTLETGIRHYSSDNREYTYAIGYEAAQTRDAFGSRDYQVLTLPLSHTRDYRDNELNAKSGYFAKASLMPFLALSGTDDGVRLSLDGRTYRSFGAEDRVTFALRGQVGAVFGPDLSTAPVDYLFYSGGGGTVRGQEYQSLGVELDNGRTVGGRSFIGLSGEIRVQTGSSLSVVGFLDAGYIGQEEFPDAESGEWHTGAGAGIRYDTGVGPIRVDVGVPLSGPDDESGFELYIGIGQSF